MSALFSLVVSFSKQQMVGLNFLVIVLSFFAQQKSDFGGFYSLKGQGLLWQQKYTLPITDVITFLYYIGAVF